MDGARTILTASNWTSTLQTTIVATTSDPRQHPHPTILAPTSDTRRTLRDMLRVLNEAHRRLGGDPDDDDEELDGATATANMDELSDDDNDDNDNDDYAENNIIEEEEEEREAGGMVDYGDAYRGDDFGGVPASAAAMADRIEKATYLATEGGDDQGAAHRTTAAVRCMICIEDFKARDDVGVMPCSHRFHHSCLVEWLARCCLCPCCRYALPSEHKRQRV